MSKTLLMARFNLILCLFIILWGAWVRLSGSGAGCGEHWPLCNGQIIPLSDSLQTLIEFTHRLTSGLFGLTVLAQLFFSFQEFNKAHPVRRYSLYALLLTIVEALIGAILVKFGLVNKNDSDWRALIIAIHLINTLLLIAVLSLSEYYSRHDTWTFKPITMRLKLFFSTVGLLFMMVSAMGAVTALGNTLFPDINLIEGMKKDFDSNSHFLIRLRVYHPMLAILLVGSILGLCQYLKSLKIHARQTSKLNALAMIALIFGLINWLLMAPTWGALVHLLLADILWISFVFLWA